MRIVRLARLSIAVLLGAVFSSATFATPALAQSEEAPNLTIQPVGGNGAYFDLSVPAGEHRDLSVRLGNAGQAAVKARTYAADAYTTVNGGLGARLWDDPKTGPTGWLNYPPESLELDAGASVERKISLTVPGDASPGQHISSLVIENEDPFTRSGEQAAQRIRQVIAVLVTVPGPITPAFKVSSAAYKVAGTKSKVAVKLENSGNVLVKPAGSIAIKSSDGSEVASGLLKMGSLYAGTAADVEFSLASTLQPGKYKAAVDLTDAATSARQTADVEFTVVAPTAAEKSKSSAAGGAAVSQSAAPATTGEDQPPLLLIVGGSVLATALLVGGAAWLISRRRRSTAS